MLATKDLHELVSKPNKPGEKRHQNLDPDFTKRAAFVIAVSAAAIVAMVTIWEARVILLVLFAGCLGALVLATLTSLLQSYLRIPRTFAFAVLLAGLGLALALGAWLRGPELAQQFGQLQVDVPEAAKRLYSSLGNTGWGRWLLDNTPDDRQLSSWLSYAASGIRGALSMVVSTLACLLLVVMASIYLAAEPEFYLSGLQRILPSSIRTTVEACLAGAIRTLRFWLLSRLISMTAIGLIIAGGLALLRVPLAGTLGIIAALLTFVPNIGPLASALPAALMAFAISPTKGFFCVGLFCLAHFIEGNFVTPLSDRQIVKLPPFLTLSLQLLLIPAAGALGVALAAPLLAATLGIVRVLFPAIPERGSLTEPAKYFDNASEELYACSRKHSIWPEMPAVSGDIIGSRNALNKDVLADPHQAVIARNRPRNRSKRREESPPGPGGAMKYLSPTSLLKGAAAFALLVFSSSIANAQKPDSKDITNLFTEIKEHAALANADAQKLDSYTRSGVSWRLHADKLNEMKEHTNALLSDYSDSARMRDEGSGWQQDAIDQLQPVLIGMADRLTAAIQFQRENPTHVKMTPFIDLIRENCEYTSKAASLIHDVVDYGAAQSTVKSLQERLSVAPSLETD